MRLIPLKAVSETIDFKKGGIVKYETDQVVDQEGIILLENPDGTYGMVLIDQVHRSGNVQVVMRPVHTPVKRYEIGQVIAQLAIFE
jgi:hypothetical protein